MKEKISDGVFAAVLTLFILSCSVTLTLAFRPLYYYDIGHLHIPETSGYGVEEIRANYDALIDYNLSPTAGELVFPTFPMSREAGIHFAEARGIFQGFLWMLAATAVCAAAGMWYKCRRKRYGCLLAAGILTPCLLLAAGGMLLIGWDRAFILFHELVFQNDYWLFDPVTDPVITILPDTFFLHCAVMILALAGAGACACLALYRHLQKKAEASGRAERFQRKP